MTNYQLPQFDMKLYYKQNEKILLSKKSNGLGFFIFAYFATMLASTIFLEAILMMLKPNDFLGSNIESVPIYYITIFSSVISAFIPGLLYFLLSNTRISDVIQTNYVKPSTFFPLIFLGMGVAMIANYAADIVANNFSIFGLENQIDFSSPSETLEEIILYVVSTAIVPAFAEEFAFRGVLMGSLRKYGDAFAIIVSAVIFGAMHGNIIQIPFAFILGLIFGFITCKTNSIFPAITIHFTNNFYAVILDILQTSNTLTDRKFVVINYIIVFVFCALAILSFFYLIKKDRNFFKMTSNDGVKCENSKFLTFKDKMQAFFICPGIILTLSLFLLETIFYLCI
ncbi:MAG: type II CAAX endopeptidase family protein [Ruminococcus sp.]|nr:type II CAAX endopeptidase family protein [Ruminococcus sp.]